MSERQLRIISNKLSASANYTSELVAKIVALETELTELKYNSQYIFQHTGECKGIFDTPGNILPISYGAGAGIEIGFGLYIPFKCRIHRMVLQSVFGSNEVANPEVQISIRIVKNNELVISYPFPNVAYGQPTVYHTGLTDQELYLDIPVAGCFIYAYASESNLIDEDARHRVSFYFKKNYLQDE